MWTEILSYCDPKLIVTIDQLTTRRLTGILNAKSARTPSRQQFEIGIVTLRPETQQLALDVLIDETPRLELPDVLFKGLRWAPLIRFAHMTTRASPTACASEIAALEMTVSKQFDAFGRRRRERRRGNNSVMLSAQIAIDAFRSHRLALIDQFIESWSS